MHRYGEAMYFPVPAALPQAKPWLAALLLAAVAGCADGWTGRVVTVPDGDTLKIGHYGEEVSVRLDEIDAPELAQAYGRQSRRSLAGLCLGRYAEIQAVGKDKYGRTLARVICAGTDVNAEQIRRGYAWFYAQYSRNPMLRELEAGARARRVGLWADPAPIPPWDFRHENAEGRPSSRESARAENDRSRCAKKRTCAEMESCEEARFYLNRCGLVRLDRNHDGVPCESLCR